MGLHMLAQYTNDIITLLSAALTGMSLLAGFLAHLRLKSKRVAEILNACLVAEKAVDKASYKNDGTLNQARLDLAMEVLKIMDPELDVDAAEKDIKTVLATIHENVETITTPSIPNTPETVTVPKL